MAKKTLSEVAKEFGIERKDLASYFEKQGKGKVTIKTTLTDEEVERAKESLGLGPKPQVRIGEERVVAESVSSEGGGTSCLVPTKKVPLSACNTIGTGLRCSGFSSV